MKHSLLIAFGALSLVACSTQPDAQIRDLRPTQIERGDKVLVEASGPMFTVGAPTNVTLNGVHVGAGVPLTVPGRAVAPNRVLFDADKAMSDLVARHATVDTTVMVEQTLNGQAHRFVSSPTAPFQVDLFPKTLHRLADTIADKVSPGDIWGWLGATVAPLAPGNAGVMVADVVTKVDRAELFARFDTPPVDGKLTKKEAHVGQQGGMSAEEFARLDTNHDDVIQAYEADEQPGDDGLAAKAGLQKGDVIVSANGKPVTDVAGLDKAWDTDEDTVKLAVKRAGADATISLPRYGKPAGIPGWLIWALCMALAAGIVALPVPVIGGLIVVWERKISAYMQVRIGPNRVGPGGWLQWLADGLKLIMKEDIVPTDADPILFKMSPYLAFVGLFLVFMVIPFTNWIVVADLNIGLLFLLSVTSLVVVSIIMGGWSSNSKWSLLGGMRSAAQIISYELPASVALLSIATLTGSLSTVSIVSAQGGAPWNWYIFANPFTFACFFIYFISALAEGNRTPFDLPEAESELVSGYNTEYSGFRFSLFPLVEWVNLFVIGAVSSMLFLGGWRLPHVSVAMQDAHGYLQLLGFAVYLAKIIAIIFVIIWIRWTLPRFRVDQMMNLCWKYFIPLSFVCFVGVLAWAWLVPSSVQYFSRFVWFGLFGLVPGWLFIKRVQYNRSRFRELSLNPML